MRRPNPRPYRVVMVPGIGEATSTDTKPNGILSVLAKELPTRFTSEQFNWNNIYGPVGGGGIAGASYTVNVDAATVTLTEYARHLIESGYHVILAGHSGGAHVATLAAEYLGTKLSGLVTVANPIRRLFDSEAPFSGIVGQHQPLDIVTLDLANPADVIPCCPPTQPIKDFYELTRKFSISDQKAWGADLLQNVLTGLVQHHVNSAADWIRAVRYVRGYLWNGEHTDWYVPHFPMLAHNMDMKFH